MTTLYWLMLGLAGFVLYFLFGSLVGKGLSMTNVEEVEIPAPPPIP